MLRLISASGAHEGGSARRKVQLLVKGRVRGGKRVWGCRGVGVGRGAGGWQRRRFKKKRVPRANVGERDAAGWTRRVWTMQSVRSPVCQQKCLSSPSGGHTTQPCLTLHSHPLAFHVLTHPLPLLLSLSPSPSVRALHCTDLCHWDNTIYKTLLPCVCLLHAEVRLNFMQMVLNVGWGW